MDFFLVRISPYSDWIRTRRNSVFGHFSRSVFYRTVLLKIFAKLNGNHLRYVLLFMIIELTFWQKWFYYRYIPTNLAKFLRAALLKHSFVLHKISLLSQPLKLAFFKCQKGNNKGLRSSNFALFSNPCLTLYVTSMSRTKFQSEPTSNSCLSSMSSLLETGAIFEV